MSDKPRVWKYPGEGMRGLVLLDDYEALKADRDQLRADLAAAEFREMHSKVAAKVYADDCIAAEAKLAAANERERVLRETLECYATYPDGIYMGPDGGPFIDIGRAAQYAIAPRGTKGETNG